MNYMNPLTKIFHWGKSKYLVVDLLKEKVTDILQLDGKKNIRHWHQLNKIWDGYLR